MISERHGEDREAVEQIQDAKAARFVDTNIDLANQAYWVAMGHTLKDGSILPKVRYFSEASHV